MDLMSQGLDLISKAISRAPSLSFEGVLSNHHWYCDGRFAPLKEKLDSALDLRCLEILAEIHPNEQEIRNQLMRQRAQSLQQVDEAPFKIESKQRDLVLALRYFESRTSAAVCFEIGPYLWAKGCFENRRWAEYSRAGDQLRQLWCALLVFDRLLWSHAKPTLGAARYMDPVAVIADGLAQGVVDYDFLIFKVRIIGQDLLIDFSSRPELLTAINNEIAGYYSR